MDKAKDESNSKFPGAYYLLFGLLFRLKTRKNVQNTSYSKYNNPKSHHFTIYITLFISLTF